MDDDDDDELARLRAENAQLKLEAAKLRRRSGPINAGLEQMTLEWASTYLNDPEGVFSDDVSRRERRELFLRRCHHAIGSCRMNFSFIDGWIWAWRAYSVCRLAGIEIPEWLLIYFDHVAVGLIRLEDAPAAERRNLAEAAGKALRTEGGLPARSDTEIRAGIAALRVAAKIDANPRAKVENLIEDMAEECGVSVSSIRRSEENKDIQTAVQRAQRARKK